MIGGWIKLYRQIRKNWIWPVGRPYTELEAWLDILLSANHTDGKVLISGVMVEVKRSEYITSEVKLSKRWNWSRDRVRRYFSLLKREEMCTTQKTTRYTKIIVNNYEVYQGGDTGLALELTGLLDNGTTADKTTNKTPDEAANNTQRRRNKNKKDFEEEHLVIIDHLNAICGTRYRLTAPTERHIGARIAEGYTLDDFKTVIIKKAGEWLGTDQAKYLRPETLFGTKMDSYLNQLEGGENGGKRENGAFSRVRTGNKKSYAHHPSQVDWAAEPDRL